MRRSADGRSVILQRWEMFIRQERGAARRYSAALLFALLFALVSALTPHGDKLHFSFIALAGTLLATVYGGTGPGLLAAVATSLVVDYFYIEPIKTILNTLGDWIYLLTYLSTASLLCMLVASLRHAYDLGSRTRREAEQAAREREELLAVISHDLRNPLSSIQMNLRLMEHQISGSERGLRLLRSIRYSAGRMDRLIEDLLDASRVDAGTLTVKPQRADLADLLRDEVQEFEPLACSKGISLESNLDGQRAPLDCDPKRILQVLGNLLGNALKYTPSGGVIVMQLAQRPGAVEVRVSDTGPGIAEKDLPLIFERNWQAKDTSHLGAGLGLYISRAIIRAHRGDIWVESERGKGSCFHVVLPRPVGAKPAGDVA